MTLDKNHTSATECIFTENNCQWIFRQWNKYWMSEQSIATRQIFCKQNNYTLPLLQ